MGDDMLLEVLLYILALKTTYNSIHLMMISNRNLSASLQSKTCKSSSLSMPVPQLL